MSCTNTDDSGKVGELMEPSAQGGLCAPDEKANTLVCASQTLE